MDEHIQRLRISMQGQARRQALADCLRQIADWDLVMPAVEPLVLDFGLGNFRRTGLIEFWIINDRQAGYCGKFLFVFDGQTCPAHGHRVKHETFFIAKGLVRMVCNDRVREMRPGDRLEMPPGDRHSFTGIGPALLLELSTPSMVEDNFFQNVSIPIGGNYRPASKAGPSCAAPAADAGVNA